MSHMYECMLTAAEIQHFALAIDKRTLKTHFCHEWTGSVNKDGYGLYRPCFRGKQIKLTVHGFNFHIHNINIFTSDMHVSHLCHNKLCIRLNHLSLEPQSVNNSRKTCALEGQCEGHGSSFPRCLFPP